MFNPSRITEAGGLSAGLGIAVPIHVGMSAAPWKGKPLPSAPGITMTWVNSIIPGGVLAVSLYLSTGDPLGDV
eukprot:8475656-Pyramimonas_sp.AAC.1